MPVRTDERWRFANLKAIQLDAYRAPAPVDAELARTLLDRSREMEAVAGRLVFANDQLLAHEPVSEALRAKGVLWLPLERAVAEHPELMARHFMREGAVLGSQKFAELHRARVRAGSVLYVPRGVEVELPFEAHHWLCGEAGSAFPHTLIIAEERSRVTLVDVLRSAGEDAGMVCGVNDLWLGAGAQVTYVSVQDWSRRVAGWQVNATVVGRDARATALALQLGGAHVRSENVSRLRGQGGRSDMLAICVADGSQEFDQRTLQVHEVEHTSSDLLFKNALDDKARTIFAGLIRVDSGAHKTDAYQKVRNLLLSDEAEANSAPGLEIEADDVRCTHGATTGQIEAEELFYLLSRGIPLRQAQRLIVNGFLHEVIERLGAPCIGEKLADRVQAKFEAERR